MDNMQKTAPVRLKTVTQGALGLALILAFFFLFRGVTNILNAFAVPLTLYIVSINKRIREILLIYLVLIVLCVIFFYLQIVFALIYCGIACLIGILNRKNVHAAIAAFVMSIAVTISFWAGIVATDYLFLTQMSNFMMRLYGGRVFVYIMVLYIEGALIGMSQLFLSRIIQKRMYRKEVGLHKT